MLAIDFDDTLNFSAKRESEFKPNLDLIKILKDKEFYILTARNSSEESLKEIVDFCSSFKIQPIDILFTDNKEKGPYMKANGFSLLVDDKEYQRDSCRKYGAESVSPEEYIENNLNNRFAKLKIVYKKSRR